MESRGQQVDPSRAEDDASQAEKANHDDQRRCDQIGQHGCFLLALLRESLREDGNESGRQCAFGKQIAREIGNAEPEQERVVDEAGAEQARHDDFAHQSSDARHGHRHRDHPGRPDHALGRRRIVNFGRQVPPNSSSRRTALPVFQRNARSS